LQLLVSVRSADEVGPALAGGADIIDAKEPDRGSLGAVDRDVLSRILQRVPDDRGVSVALGDVSRPEEVGAAIHGLELPQRTSPTYLKLGFAGVRSPDQIGLLIEHAVSVTSPMAAFPRIVAVAYADFERAGTMPPVLIPSLAEAGGAAAVLLDTHGKDGRGLLEWLPSGALVDWVALARQPGRESPAPRSGSGWAGAPRCGRRSGSGLQRR
jgi:(5-formylfuran-3-yl)methyl phosphate synthase